MFVAGGFSTEHENETARLPCKLHLLNKCCINGEAFTRLSQFITGKKSSLIFNIVRGKKSLMNETGRTSIIY